jgi:hypothetical protein
MKKILTFVAVIALTASSTFAGDISTSRAARLGLAGMQPMSQSQGEQIRGMGVAIVAGGSYAAVRGAASANVYFGASHTRNAAAAGANLSFAANTRGSGAIAGGGSVAYAK